MENSFIIFGLYAHIVPFTVQQAMIGDSLKRSGYQPIFVRPWGCTCRLKENLAAWHPGAVADCGVCSAYSTGFQITSQDWGHETLDGYAATKDLEIVETAVSGLSRDNFREFVFRDIPVGRLAAYQLILDHKVDEFSFEENHALWADYLSGVKGCILIALWMDRCIDSRYPRGLLVFNAFYGINRAVCILAGLKGVPWYTTEGGASLRYHWDHIQLWRGCYRRRLPLSVKNWRDRYSRRILSYPEVALVGDHFRNLFSARDAHAYSSPAGSEAANGIKEKLDRLSPRKIILATTSSPDERVAGEIAGYVGKPGVGEVVFESQLEWLTFLVKRVTDSPDIAMVIRVHPREFPNKRDAQYSQNAMRLRGLLTELPDHIIVNWPEDNMSIYDLFLKVDLVLTGWSTSLLEASLFGCPIIVPKDPHLAYSAISDVICHSAEDYWAAIRAYIVEPWNLLRTLKTFRWLWYWHFGDMVSMVGGQERGAGPEEVAAIGHIPALEPFLKRRVGFNGEAAVVKILLGELDPVSNPAGLEQVQTDLRTGDEGEPTGEELGAVFYELKSLLGQLMPQGGYGGKPWEMIRGIEAAG